MTAQSVVNKIDELLIRDYDRERNYGLRSTNYIYEELDDEDETSDDDEAVGGPRRDIPAIHEKPKTLSRCDAIDFDAAQ